MAVNALVPSPESFRKPPNNITRGLSLFAGLPLIVVPRQENREEMMLSGIPFAKNKERDTVKTVLHK